MGTSNQETASAAIAEANAPLVPAVSYEERISKLESALEEALKAPPSKMPEAAELKKEIAAAKGMAEHAVKHVGAVSDQVIDQVTAVTRLVEDVAVRLRRVEEAKGIAEPLPRDDAHDNARVKRTFRCVGCQAEQDDTVQKNAANAEHKTCRLCGNKAEIISVEVLDPE